MTQRVNISPGHQNHPASAGLSFKHGGGEFVAEQELITEFYDALTTGPLNSFNYTGNSGLDVTIDTGEAVVGGAGLAKDTTTTVTLEQNLKGQSIYLGWEHKSTDSVKIGHGSDFLEDDHKIEIWRFDTDSSTVTSSTDKRPLGPTNAKSRMFVTKGDGDYAILSNNETVTGSWTFDSQTSFVEAVAINHGAINDNADLYIRGDNAVDTSTVVIDGDGDDGQDDDVLKVRGGTDPTSLGDSDTRIVVKGNGRIGINEYSPQYALDVSGAMRYLTNDAGITFSQYNGQPMITPTTGGSGHDDRQIYFTGSEWKIEGKPVFPGGINANSKISAPGITATAADSTFSNVRINATANHLIINDTETSGKYWYIDQNGETLRFFMKNENTGSFQDHLTIDPSSGEMDYSGGTVKEGGNPLLASGDGVDRDLYESSTEPSAMENDDLWLKPRE